MSAAIFVLLAMRALRFLWILEKNQKYTAKNSRDNTSVSAFLFRSREVKSAISQAKKPANARDSSGRSSTAITKNTTPTAVTG
jgi:hypothetical protein